MPALPDAVILRFNPWWSDPAWELHDPHLEALRERRVELELETFSADLPLSTPAVHVVRGPRQVGKSTALKKLIRRAVSALGADAVVYLAFDELADRPIGDVTETVRSAKRLATGDERSASLVVLDEVTAARGWADAVKALWDEGTMRRDVVVCTGSSAVDLHADAVERLPGRRGAGRDALMLPASFAAFARAGDSRIPAAPALDVAALVSPDGVELLRRSRRFLPALEVAAP